MNSKIIPVPPQDITSLLYFVGAPVLRVFDSNSVGHLIPVAFHSGGMSFKLLFAQYGQIYAEVAI